MEHFHTFYFHSHWLLNNYHCLSVKKFPIYHDIDAFQKQNCTEGNIGPFSITPHFSRGVTKLLHDLENFHDVKPQEMLQIVWKQKHKRELGTCDNKILTPLLIRACLS